MIIDEVLIVSKVSLYPPITCCLLIGVIDEEGEENETSSISSIVIVELVVVVVVEKVLFCGDAGNTRIELSLVLLMFVSLSMSLSLLIVTAVVFVFGLSKEYPENEVISWVWSVVTISLIIPLINEVSPIFWASCISSSTSSSSISCCCCCCGGDWLTSSLPSPSSLYLYPINSSSSVDLGYCKYGIGCDNWEWVEGVREFLQLDLTRLWYSLANLRGEINALIEWLLFLLLLLLCFFGVISTTSFGVGFFPSLVLFDNDLFNFWFSKGGKFDAIIDLEDLDGCCCCCCKL